MTNPGNQRVADGLRKTAAGQPILAAQPIPFPVPPHLASPRPAQPGEPEDRNPAMSASGAFPNLRVHFLSPTDLPTVARLPIVVPVGSPDTELHPYRLPVVAATMLAPWSKKHGRMLVARSGDDLVGIAHFRIIGSDRRWVLAALGAGTGVYDPEPVWEALVAGGIKGAGLSGARRLFARAQGGTPQHGALRRSGFIPYATETLWVTHHLQVRPGLSTTRPQQQADTWAIHQLSNAVVPPDVQVAEALTSHWWDLDGDDLERGTSRNGLLIEQDGVLRGYVRITSHGSSHHLEVIASQDDPEAVRDLLDNAIVWIARSGPVDCVTCGVRGYTAYLADALASRGFAPVGESELMIRHTVASVRAPVPEGGRRVPVFARRAPRRVPTTYDRPPDTVSPRPGPARHALRSRGRSCPS